MTQDEKKRAAASAAIEFVPRGIVVGVGTGSTANHFIDALADMRQHIEGTVASSKCSARRLREHGIPVLDLAEVGSVDIYVDGADEATRHRHLVKGGGGALTGEKITAAAARRFVCIVDDSKLVGRLGVFPVPIEVIPMASSLVARELVRLGGRPVLRADFTTDNGNRILDVHGLEVVEPMALEGELNQIPGVVANGLFARRGADILLVASDDGVSQIG